MRHCPLLIAIVYVMSTQQSMLLGAHQLLQPAAKQHIRVPFYTRDFIRQSLCTRSPSSAGNTVALLSRLLCLGILAVSCYFSI